MVCKYCKETLELKDAKTGGYTCPRCNKFTAKERATICCLEKKGIGDNKCKPKIEIDLNK
jgi:hypothetical protein